jgi:hypothetical protein
VLSKKDNYFKLKFYIRSKYKINIINKVSMNIGVDFGSVLSKHKKGYETDNSNSVYEIDIPDCIEVLKYLKEKYNSKIHLISFCGKTNSTKTKKYLQELNLFPGLFDTLNFVKRPTFKSELENHLGIGLMIDDRLDVLESFNCQTLHFTYDTVCFDYEPDNKFFVPTYSLSTWNKVKEWFDSGIIKNTQKIPRPILESRVNYLCYKI